MVTVKNIVCSMLLFVLPSVILINPAALAKQTSVTAGSKKFTESVILGEMVVGLAHDAGYEGRHWNQLGGSRILWESIRKQEIDIYPDYTGTIDQVIFPDRDLNGIEEIREVLDERKIKMTEPLGFNNTYAIAMKEKRAEELAIETISDLRDYPDLTLGFTNEFMDRKDGWPGLRSVYDLPHQDVQGLDHDLAYQGLASGDIDVIDAYTTDAAIEYHDLRLLEDDRNHFPRYQAVFLYREELRERAPGVVEKLKTMEGAITANRIRKLNKSVKIDGASEERVAQDFLERKFGIRGSVETATVWSRLGQRTLEHLFLVGVSLGAAVLLAVPLGILATRSQLVGQIVLGMVGILQTIPSLALLVFMIPLFGIGTRPALVALFLYSLLPIVRNTYAGINDIPNDLKESARAIGLPSSTILTRIKLPMAMRSILAGIKTSAVINVGVATLGALIGAGGYGQPILTGIRLDDMVLVLEGAVPAALLALAVQGSLDLLGLLLVPRGLRLSE
jgi:osmoprotectant transport system permease protein